jgi:hypothetical protein
MRAIASETKAGRGRHKGFSGNLLGLCAREKPSPRLLALAPLQHRNDHELSGILQANDHNDDQRRLVRTSQG